jgi:peptidyl-tRNA hydrolase
VKAEAEIKEHLRKEDVIKKRHQEWQKERQQKGVLKQDNQKNRNSFIPSNEWQEVPKGATMPNGLTFKMDMKTGKNYAKKA